MVDLELDAKIREVVQLFSAQERRMVQEHRNAYLEKVRLKLEPIVGKVWEHDKPRNSQDAMRRIFSYSHVQMNTLSKFVYISLLSYCK